MWGSRVAVHVLSNTRYFCASTLTIPPLNPLEVHVGTSSTVRSSAVPVGGNPGYAFLLLLIVVKIAEYAIVGVARPAFPVMNLVFFLTGMAMCLALANFQCFLRRVKFQTQSILRLYFMTSVIMAPVSLWRISDALAGQESQASWLGLGAKAIQLGAFFTLVHLQSKYYPAAD